MSIISVVSQTTLPSIWIPLRSVTASAVLGPVLTVFSVLDSELDIVLVITLLDLLASE